MQRSVFYPKRGRKEKAGEHLHAAFSLESACHMLNGGISRTHTHLQHHSITKNAGRIQEGNTQAKVFTEMATGSRGMVFSLLLYISSCFQVLRFKNPEYQLQVEEG